MHCKAEGVLKNFRYRILTIEGKYYILDMDKPFIVCIIPFIFWMLPHTVYQIDKQELERLRVPEIKKSNSFLIGLIGVSIGYPISKLVVEPLMNYFHISMTITLKLFILMILIIVMLIIRKKISNIDKVSIEKKVYLNKANKSRLRIWSNSLGYIIKNFLIYYLFFLIFGCLLFYSFLESGNFVILFFFLIVFFPLLMLNLFVVLKGDFKVKWL